MSATAVPIQPLARGSVAKLWLGLVVLALAAAGLAWLGTASQQRITTASGLQYRVIEEGTGAPVTPADLVALRYQLRKADGTLIQDSDETGQPFVTGTEGVFPGFSEGLQLMREGGRYKLWIPPGQHISQPMGADAPFTPQDTLVFEIEVMQVGRGMAAMQQLMRAPGGPGGPEGAMPEGAMPEGAGPGGAAPPAGAPPAEAPPGRPRRR